ncbi:MAG: sulfur carrier protein ThiS [Desulfatiglandaceae bacterium]
MIKVKGKDFAWREGMSVADLLTELNDAYPYAVVRVNNTLVSRPDFDRTLVPDNSEIFLIPMIAGG